MALRMTPNREPSCRPIPQKKALQECSYKKTLMVARNQSIKSLKKIAADEQYHSNNLELMGMAPHHVEQLQ